MTVFFLTSEKERRGGEGEGEAAVVLCSAQVLLFVGRNSLQGVFLPSLFFFFFFFPLLLPFPVPRRELTAFRKVPVKLRSNYAQVQVPLEE